MWPRGWVSAVAAVVLVLTLSGCDDSDDARTPTEAQEKDAPQEADTGLCTFLTIRDVADSYGVEIDRDAVGSGTSDENNRTWTYETCSWETPEQIEVHLAVATADDFPDGVLACPPLSHLGTPGTPVDGLGADAWWVESGFNEEEGTLRVCTRTHLVDIDADRPHGSVDSEVLKEQSVDLAAKLLLRLGG